MSYNPSKTLTGSYAVGSSAVSASQPGAGGYAGSTSGYPASGSLSGYPASGSMSGYPATGSVSGYPAGGSVSGYPAGGSVSGYPAGGSVSGYPAPGSTSGYGQGAGYSGSTSSYPASVAVTKPGYSGSTSAAPQGGYTASTSSHPNAPQGYTSSTSSYPAPSSKPKEFSGSTSQYPPKETSASTSSYPASNAAPATYNTQKSYASQAPTIGARSVGGKSQMQLSPAARLIRRGPPPRFRPWMIILVTMSLGIMFIGIVLTIVAHWPGYTAIGSDPLEIVGPTMLAVGGVGFGTCIVLSVVHTRQEKEDFMHKIAASQKSIYASRMTIQSNQSAIGYGNYADAKVPSQSSFAQPQGVGDGDSGHPSTHTYNSTNMSYEPDSDTSETAGAGKYEVYKIETLPDPNAQVPEGQQAVPGEVGVDAVVPEPVRARTRNTKKQAKADPHGQNNGAYNQSPPQVTGRNSPMAGSGALGGVSASPMPGAEAAAPRRLLQDYSQEGYDVYDPEGEAKPKKEKREKKKKHKKAPREAEAMQASAAPGGNGNRGYEGASGQQTPQEPLRIAIKAQPGAQVCITPGFSSQQPDPAQGYAQPQAQMARHESTETEI